MRNLNNVAHFGLIFADVIIFPYDCSDQTNNVRKPEPITGNSLQPH